MTPYLVGAFVYLCAALVAVPLAKRLGLGSVLGYLIAGVVIGPLLGLVGSETATLQHFAEFGVVMMLFLVGLEIEPRSLWRMRGQLLGLGGLQVGATAALLAAIALALGVVWQSALAIGLIGALSSTAIVLQTFQEKGLARTPGGRSAFSVLLFQDIAVIPMLALLPLLALPELAAHAADAAAHGAGHDDMSWVAHLEGWQQGLVTLAAIGAVVAGGRYLGAPLFAFVARAGLREAFTTTALALVVGVAALMSLVGLSPALGAFLAGVVLANSEFRHELESDIEPFKGLLLGLFFITVGAGIRFELLAEAPGRILLLTLGIMGLKAAVLFGLALLFGIRRSDGWLFTLSLAQAGEFGFVLLGFSVQNAVLAPELAATLSLAVALSMFLTPLLFIAFDRVVQPRYAGAGQEQPDDHIDERGTVIIAGMGRFGQIVNRLLTANDVPTVVIDRDMGEVEAMRAVGFKTYFGDVTRPELVRTAGAAEARAFVVAIDEPEQALALVRHLKRTYPRLQVLARAFDRVHQYQLLDAGADYALIETHRSALALGVETARRLGYEKTRTEEMARAFDAVEREGHRRLYEAWQKRAEGERVGADYRKLFMELQGVLREAMRGGAGSYRSGGRDEG